MKYRSSSLLGKIRQLLWELWPFFDFILYEKLVSVHYLWKHWYIEFISYTQVYNHKIQVKFDLC